LLYHNQKQETSQMRLNAKVVVFFLFIAVTGVQPARAQITTGEIRGVVTDAVSKEPLVGAQVSLKDSKIGAATNINGEYVIRRLQPGEYTVVARYVGYRTATKTVTVTAGSSVKVDLELSPSAVQADELVVTGQGVATEKRKLTTAVEFITSDRIDGAVNKSLDRLLQGNVPGLTAYLPSGCRVLAHEFKHEE
jgi:hypothetical protein